MMLIRQLLKMKNGRELTKVVEAKVVIASEQSKMGTSQRRFQ